MARPSRTWVMVSLTRDAAIRLSKNGPRRDVLELAHAIGGHVVYQRASARRRGVRGRLFGPHVRQAWHTAALARRGDVVFADGEHNGLPTLLALAVHFRRGVRVVMLGHLVSPPWKRALFRVATRLGSPGTLVLHSVEQRARITLAPGGRWQTALVPYQVDTHYWTGPETPPPGPPLFVAVGAENRDYATLVEAARGCDASFVIAAGSHWARSAATAAALPPNVAFVGEPLPYLALRDLYRRATAVVVPLQDVPNQSGVTVILEAMSCGLPVVVTASRGQRECVAGPLVRADGSIDEAATFSRGPQLFGESDANPMGRHTGLYVLPGDPVGLRRALGMLAADASLCRTLGAAGRAAAERTLGVDAFVSRLAAIIRAESGPDPRAANMGSPASPEAVAELVLTNLAVEAGP